MRRALAVSLALLPAVVRADDVFTRGGGRLTGDIVERRSHSIVVDVGGGTIELPASYVERIVPGPSPMALYRERAERLAPDDAPGWVALGQWARQHDLRTQADEAFEQALAADPEHAAARQALGQVRVGEQWMTREESYRARGLVPYEGRWVTLEERQLLAAERAAAAEQVQAEAEALARLRDTEARARQAEAHARVAEAEARMAEVDADRAESSFSSIQWLPLGVPFGRFGSFSSLGLNHGFLPGCDWRGRSMLGLRGAVHLPGRGGTLMVSGGLRPAGRRTR